MNLHLPPREADLLSRTFEVGSSRSLQAAFASLRFQTRQLRPREDVLRLSARPRKCSFVIEGMLHRYRVLENGKRQILSFHVPGDIPDLFGLFGQPMDHNLSSLGEAVVGIIAHEQMREAMQQDPNLCHLLWREALVDAGIARAWILGLGRRTARARLAHLFCEVFTRLAAVGLVRDDRFRFPVTQSDLGDALGLSTVHVNRSLQELRRVGLLRLENGHVTILDWTRLTAVAGFDPAYLCLEDNSPAATAFSRRAST